MKITVFVNANVIVNNHKDVSIEQNKKDPLGKVGHLKNRHRNLCRETKWNVDMEYASLTVRNKTRCFECVCVKGPLLGLKASHRMQENEIMGHSF